MPIKTQSAKAKGRNLQKHVKERILHHDPRLEEDDVQSRSMGAGGVDIMLSPKAQHLVGLSIECKKTRKTPSTAELKQARSNAYDKTVPCVVWCPHGKGPSETMIMFNLEDFLGDKAKNDKRKPNRDLS